MDRAAGWNLLTRNNDIWDFVVIGGGSTGLGTALDAAARGYRTLLLEQHDFAKGTSSRSTKLVHGGVRYLRQGNVRLVLDALRERALMLRNAPHLVHPLDFLIPAYRLWERGYYGIGLKAYDLLARGADFARSRVVDRHSALELLPTLEPVGLRGGVLYQDGQFDDARLAVNLAQTIWDRGGVALNYSRITGLLKSGGRVAGVRVRDQESGGEIEVKAAVVVNAAGVFCDDIRVMDEPEVHRLVALSQGAHVVLPREFLPGDTALMVPDTSDGRVLFAIPWHGRVVVGTTDTPLAAVSMEPKPFEEEIDFILSTAAHYLTSKPRRSDVLSVFAGLRPLVQRIGAKSTAAMPRDHLVAVSDSGLITITGGKWTTYRKMAEDAVSCGERVGMMNSRKCITADLPIHGASHHASGTSLDVYGSDAEGIRKLADSDPMLSVPIHPRLPYLAAEVVWAVRHEMARTAEDVLARRTRALLLDATASIEAAQRVSEIMERELGGGADWMSQQVTDFRAVAERYLL
jgi:glycerol-3-phosphate dehydrogenase